MRRRSQAGQRRVDNSSIQNLLLHLQDDRQSTLLPALHDWPRPVTPVKRRL